MKNLLLLGLALGLALFVWTRQHSRGRSVTLENARLAATLNELEARARQADAGRQVAEQTADEIRTQLASHDGAPGQTVLGTNSAAHALFTEPDPSHQGGWPKDAEFFYFPKQYLTNIDYNLLEGGHLTDQASILLGMSPVERSRVDQLFTDMLDNFRRVEIARMKPIAPPEGWTGATFGAKLDSAVVCQIPSLVAETEAARQLFSEQVQQTLGSSRAQILERGTDAFLRQNLDDLGAGERTVGFLTATEHDGSHSVWYGVADARHGDGSFQRVPSELAPDSQIAYYASLLGVPLPTK